MILFTSLLPKIVILEFTSSREGKTPFTIIFFPLFTQRSREFSVTGFTLFSVIQFKDYHAFR